jgi:hypothetical protein
MHRRGYTTQLGVSTRGAEPTRFSNAPNLIGERTSNFVTPSVGGEFSDLASYKCRAMLSGAIDDGGGRVTGSRRQIL